MIHLSIFGKYKQPYQNVEANDKGVMLEREDLKEIDIEFSRQFLDETISKKKNFTNNPSVLDCGAGIGRLS